MVWSFGTYRPAESKQIVKCMLSSFPSSHYAVGVRFLIHPLI
ncbi:hypothetical protein VPHD292_0054 [Vibrio phage D292]